MSPIDLERIEALISRKELGIASATDMAQLTNYLLCYAEPLVEAYKYALQKAYENSNS